jgi:16S rRNA U516 pseudouridylate synthase RsuA-like enzyme
VRIMNITVDHLPVGQWKNLTDRERDELFKALGDSP